MTPTAGEDRDAESGREPDIGRHETTEERADRLWTDLLQELRVAQTGVQILFGFLLAVVFQPRFAALSDTDRTIYVVTVMLGSATAAALIGPVSLHRLLTGHRLKPQTVAWASRMTVLGLVLLFCTMCSALLLILRVALHNALALWLVGAMALWFLVCWFVFPAWVLARSTSEDETSDAHPARGGRPDS
ncbi:MULTISPECIES: DUF6328 family protein [unclassified Streptomyces]|uniref:DUF6328 family protein n=1 Tax=unclassified Streptomyces TaxID=2593676 RepID=UPI002DD8D364|nr:MULTISPECIES: DUF6328 family protein [unclassified Streptomyces]WSF88940.1 DUF6328 family protein [Streptomyces sp. NBC_01744]WSC34888.1 DUF6328 family protein [Streptomyces sp. NBC_01763]WSC43250.1 DUF6328 family protein [Streptomyces sp. NBC_01762]WSC57837.1 DUF6328 family protein [Streptomyces sp. NBC_01761]WSD22787.1 DUF6328 family protein [Streptomyces sp. NBC_01751]